MVAVRGANDGLTHHRKRCWIVVDEYNYDVAERSWYIGPDEQALGGFSKDFMMRIAFGEAPRKSGRRVNRTE